MQVLKLNINKSNKHFYAQLINPFTGDVILNATTLEKDFFPKDSFKYANKESVQRLGELISKRLHNTGINTIIYNQKKYNYHGKIKVFLDTLRQQGIIFGKESILLKK